MKNITTGNSIITRMKNSHSVGVISSSKGKEFFF